MGGNEQVDGSLEQLIKDLAGSREEMNSHRHWSHGAIKVTRSIEQATSGQASADEKGDLMRKFSEF